MPVEVLVLEVGSMRGPAMCGRSDVMQAASNRSMTKDWGIKGRIGMLEVGADADDTSWKYLPLVTHPEPGTCFAAATHMHTLCPLAAAPA
jgi:hypothetical protein